MKVKKVLIKSIFLAVIVGFLAWYLFFPAKDSTTTIIEADDITVVSKYIDWKDIHQTLVIFDIDNTLAEPVTELGSDQWFYAMVNKLEQQGLSHKEAIDKVLPTLFELHETLKFKPTQPDAAQYIHSLQTAGINVFVLTSRSLQLARRTIVQLKEIGFDFSRNGVCPIEINLTTEHPSICTHGIIFAGHNEKGDALLRLFEKLKFMPHEVILVDDKLYNIQDVQESLEKHGISFIGIRYNRLDKKVKEFKLEETHDELEEFYKEHPGITPALAY